MKKIVMTTFLVCAVACAHAQENRALNEYRAALFQESKQIKVLMPVTKDPVMVSSMWDSCIMSINQLDAYFSMLGLFNAIPKDSLTEKTTDFLLNWLDSVKKNNTLNLRSLTGAPKDLEPRTRVYSDKLIVYYKEMNRLLEEEIKKVTAVRQSLKANQAGQK